MYTYDDIIQYTHTGSPHTIYGKTFELENFRVGKLSRLGHKISIRRKTFTVACL